MRTEKQRAASRTNGAKSKGPASEIGKERTRHNSTKHGILAQKLLLQGRFTGEDQNQFDELHDSLREDWSPKGAQEDLIVKHIATFYWRLKRATRSEAGKLSGRLEREYWRFVMGISTDDPNDREFSPMHKLHAQLNDLALDIEAKRVRLLEIRETLTREGKLSDGHLSELKRMTRKQSKAAEALTIEFAFPELYEAHSGNVEINDADPADLEAQKKQIDCSLNVLQGMKTLALNAAQNIVESTFDASSINTPAENATILRYETAIYKQLYRAIAMLKMLQNDRRNAERQTNSILPNEPKRDTKS